MTNFITHPDYLSDILQELNKEATVKVNINDAKTITIPEISFISKGYRFNNMLKDSAKQGTGNKKKKYVKIIIPDKISNSTFAPPLRQEIAKYIKLYLLSQTIIINELNYIPLMVIEELFNIELSRTIIDQYYGIKNSSMDIFIRKLDIDILINDLKQPDIPKFIRRNLMRQYYDKCRKIYNDIDIMFMKNDIGKDPEYLINKYKHFIHFKESEIIKNCLYLKEYTGSALYFMLIYPETRLNISNKLQHKLLGLFSLYIRNHDNKRDQPENYQIVKLILSKTKIGYICKNEIMQIYVDSLISSNEHKK